MRLNSVACQRRLTVLSNVCDNSASNFKLLSAVTTPPCSCNGQKETGFYVTPKDLQKGKQQQHTHRELRKKKRKEKNSAEGSAECSGLYPSSQCSQREVGCSNQKCSSSTLGERPSNQCCIPAIGREIIEQTAMRCHKLLHPASCNKYSFPKPRVTGSSVIKSPGWQQLSRSRQRRAAQLLPFTALCSPQNPRGR